MEEVSMKKAKGLSIILVFALALSILPAIPASAKVKISATKKTLYVGKSMTLKVTGTKKKVKWSSSNKKVATVTQKGKVTAKKKGTTTIQAKVAKSTFKCKVTVKNQSENKVPEPTTIPYETPEPDSTKTPDTGSDVTEVNDSEKIDSEYQEYTEGIVGIYKNNNDYAVSLEVKVVYYNSSGQMLDSSTDFNYCLGAGKSTALNFYLPTDDNFDYVTYNSYKAFMTVEKSYANDYSASVKYSSNVGASSVMCEVSNTGTKDLDSVCLACVYYDSNNKVIGYDYSYPDCNKAGTSNVVSFYLPYDENYDTITPASYKIFEKGIYLY